MNYATIKTHDTANGPGVRVSLFVSGCTHQCKGCFNPKHGTLIMVLLLQKQRKIQSSEDWSPGLSAGFRFWAASLLSRLINRHFCRCCVRYVRLILKKRSGVIPGMILNRIFLRVVYVIGRLLRSFFLI